MPIRVRTGQIIGRDHMMRQANCQDSHAVGTHGSHFIGIVCDGCGSSTHSEVGAKLAAQYLTDQAIHMLNMNKSLDEIPHLLYQSMISFLNYLVVGMQPHDPVAYIEDYLLFTIVGVIASEDEGVIFTAGDGLIKVDECEQQIDQDNTPTYIAYHLLDLDQMAGFTMPDSFQIHPVKPDWQQIAIATDGFEAKLLPEVWGLQHERGLQRMLNRWSMQERRFTDDTTIITLERLP